MNKYELMLRSGSYNRIHRQQRRARNARIMLLFVIFALIALIVWMSLGVLIVTGNSMRPTMLDGDQVLYMKGSYTPKRGDIIIIESDLSPSGKIVKRVIGLPGDELEIDNSGYVTLNGVAISEEYALFGINYDVETAMENTGFEVAEGSVLVLGDNRATSHDSRFQDVGFIQIRRICGRAILLLRGVN